MPCHVTYLLGLDLLVIVGVFLVGRYRWYAGAAALPVLCLIATEAGRPATAVAAHNSRMPRPSLGDSNRKTLIRYFPTEVLRPRCTDGATPHVRLAAIRTPAVSRANSANDRLGHVRGDRGPRIHVGAAPVEPADYRPRSAGDGGVGRLPRLHRPPEQGRGDENVRERPAGGPRRRRQRRAPRLENDHRTEQRDDGRNPGGEQVVVQGRRNPGRVRAIVSPRFGAARDPIRRSADGTFRRVGPSSPRTAKAARVFSRAPSGGSA
jgi:hypothetical protein